MVRTTLRQWRRRRLCFSARPSVDQRSPGIACATPFREAIGYSTVKISPITRKLTGRGGQATLLDSWGVPGMARKSRGKPPIRQMTIRDFERIFPDEEACKLY